MKINKHLLGVLLIAIAITGPLVAFAGISVIWPGSITTIDVDETPPITFDWGDDYGDALGLGFATALTGTNNNGSFTITILGLSGGTVTIDRFLNVSKDAAISEFKVETTAAPSGISPTTLKLRFWTGGTPPTADNDAQVCAVLNLTGVEESSGACSATSMKAQLIYTLPDGQTTESDTATVRPSSIVFA